MRTIAMMMLAAVAQPAMAQDVQPLQPSGKWVVEHQDSLCLLSCEFGEGSAKVTFGLRPILIGSTFEVVLLDEEKGRSKLRREEARLVLEPSGRTVTAESSSYRSKGKRLALFDISVSDVEDIAKSAKLAIAIGNEPATVISPVRIAAALKVLADCQINLRKHWGFNEEVLAQIVTEPESLNPDKWISPKDYPSRAVVAGAEGITTLLWSIDTKGAVFDCRIIKTSGFALLDDAACGAVTKRGRYRPALDKDGKPIRSFASRRVRWVLP